MEDEKPKHNRRERYKGTHPKAFKEKYKEQQPTLYAADIEKVIEQGRTPAGMHRSICVTEIMDILNIKPGQIGLDATLGYGGHSLEMLKRLNFKGKLYATDVDPFELPRTKERLATLGYSDEFIVIKKMNFAGIDQVAAEAGLFNFVLADLGVSSMQIDNPERGFSFKVEGPLFENADEPFYEVIAKAIITHIKSGGLIATTTALKKIISDALELVPKQLNKDDIKKSCQRCFQALRIEVNDEFGVLDQFLDKLPDTLASGAKVAILSFHSGEDRRVKKSFQYLCRAGIYSEVAPDPIRASAEECFTNPRAKSAKLRWAIKA
jgi:16S rRNA (cytosine1402-N4)-methyltransferase